MSIFDDLKNLLQSSSQNRIADESKKLARPKVRPITYQGDRNTQELGNGIIENGVPLNNASKAIGDQMMPLAKGNVLKRIDNVNVSPALGTALRDGLEKDNASGNKLSKNGGGLPSTPNDPLKGTPASTGGGKKFPTVPPPDGCFPVSSSCVWSPSTTPPAGYQSYGSVDTGSDKFGVVYLYCKGVVPPSDLGCDFLKVKKFRWEAVASALYSNAPPGFCTIPALVNTVVASGIIDETQKPVQAIIENSRFPPPGCAGKNHYKFVDALGNELGYIGSSSDGYTINYYEV